MFKCLILLSFITSLNALASGPSASMKHVVAKEEAIQNDLTLILKEASLSTDLIQFKRVSVKEKNQVSISCSNNRYYLEVEATDLEWASVLYYGLQKLGFYFIHPRMTIRPAVDTLSRNCGKTFGWKPAFSFRGFHLHTLHPNEWVHGFLMGKTKIANDYIRWLARNSQNVFDLNLVRMKKKEIFKNLKGPFALAKSLGVFPGIALGAALQQQKSYKLLSLFTASTGIRSNKKLKKRLKHLSDNIDFSFLTLEAGTSEFTGVNYQRSLQWMNSAAEVLSPQQRQLFTKVHVSSNQHHPEYGNYNFLPQYAKHEVGILPHTVHFYSLYDEKAPMYGNRNFHHIRDFAYKEKGRRPTWYYPETSYFIFMDIDVPIFLTDYLKARAEDMRALSRESFEGHLNFTTGQEIGYWLMDWTVALLNNRDYDFDPMIGLRLLGEDEAVWSAILDFQTKYIKNGGIISMISAANFQDELTSEHRIHARKTLAELSERPDYREIEIMKLQNSLIDLPPIAGIKNDELRGLLKVTFFRIKHALALRKALRGVKGSPLREGYLSEARELRKSALLIMNDHIINFDRYPESMTFEEHKNPTSYQFGYGYTTSNLILWKREEEQIRREKWSPFFMSIYKIFGIIF